MAKKPKKEINVIWLILISLGVLFLVQNSDTFMGAFVTTVENIEPSSMTEWEQFSLQNNFTIDGLDYSSTDYNCWDINTETGTVTSVDCDALARQYGVVPANVFGDELTIMTLPVNVSSCSDLLSFVDQAGDNSTQYTVIQERQVLLVPSGIMWCNYDNNLMLNTEDLAVLSNYYAEFENVTMTEVILTGDECLNASGDWNGVVCTCWDETIITDINATCPEDNRTREISTPTTTTSVNETEATLDTDAPEEVTFLDSIKENKILVFGIILCGAIMIYYFGFEAGPNKGFIKKKTSRRRRRRR
jgi:hypothetical protein